MIDDATAHQTSHQASEEAVGDERKEVVACEDWMRRLIHWSMRFMSELVGDCEDAEGL